MSIIHVNKNATLGYTILTRATLDDSRLSWKARGLLSYLLSKPDHWQVSIKHLTTQSLRDGRSAVQSALQELKRYGYAKLRTIRGPGGRVMGKRWDIYEVPEPELDLPPAPVGPMPPADPLPSTDRPKMYPSVLYRQTGFPTVGKPGRKECIEKKEYIEKEKSAHARVRDVGARTHALQDKDQNTKPPEAEATASSVVSTPEPSRIVTTVESSSQTADDVPLHVEACALDALDPMTYQILERTARDTLEAQEEPSWAIIRPMLDRTMLGLLNTGIALPGQDTLQNVSGNATTLETAVTTDLQPAKVYEGRVDGPASRAGQARKYGRHELQRVLVGFTAWAYTPMSYFRGMVKGFNSQRRLHISGKIECLRSSIRVVMNHF